MRLLRVTDNLFINLDRVLYAEIESLGVGRKYGIRWTLQGNRTYMHGAQFDTRDQAAEYLAKIGDPLFEPF